MKIFGCIGLILAFFLAGCSRSGVDVQNHTKSQVTNVEIRVAGNILSIGRLDAGESRRVRYSTKTEETISVRFLLAGIEKNCAEPIYVSPPFEDEFTVRILPGGKCSISVKEAS